MKFFLEKIISLFCYFLQTQTPQNTNKTQYTKQKAQNTKHKTQNKTQKYKQTDFIPNKQTNTIGKNYSIHVWSFLALG